MGIGRIIGMAIKRTGDGAKSVTSSVGDSIRQAKFHRKIGVMPTQTTSPIQTKGLHLTPMLAEDTVEISKKANGQIQFSNNFFNCSISVPL